MYEETCRIRHGLATMELAGFGKISRYFDIMRRHLFIDWPATENDTQ